MSSLLGFLAATMLPAVGTFLLLVSVSSRRQP